MRRRFRHVALLVVAVMLAHLASMTIAPMAMHATAGEPDMPHTGGHHAAPDSSAVGDLASVHDAATCIATGELATTPRAPLSPLIGLAALPVDMRWDIQVGDPWSNVHPEPPPPDAGVRRALLQVFLN